MLWKLEKLLLTLFGGKTSFKPVSRLSNGSLRPGKGGERTWHMKRHISYASSFFRSGAWVATSGKVGTIWAYLVHYLNIFISWKYKNRATPSWKGVPSSSSWPPLLLFSSRKWHLLILTLLGIPFLLSALHITLLALTNCGIEAAASSLAAMCYYVCVTVPDSSFGLFCEIPPCL